ncbi:MAG: co-chaperone GroES, partial [Ktedonobacteraceae bacterium]|nr:co-chaperone GroES [Ktedonobacteraceae bacterium]
MIQPFGDRVLVKVETAPQQTASGIYLPDTSRESPNEGKIVAIGEGSPLQEKLSLGDHILFQKLAGTEIKLDDGTYVLLSENDILGRVVEMERVGSAV